MKILSRLETLGASGKVRDVIRILDEASNGLFGELPVSFLFNCPLNGLSISKPDFEDIDCNEYNHLYLLGHKESERFTDNSGQYVVKYIALSDPKNVVISFEEKGMGIGRKTRNDFLITNASISYGNDDFYIKAKSGSILSDGTIVMRNVKCDLQIYFPSHPVKKKFVQVLHL